MKLSHALDGIGINPGVFISQKFGNVWIASQDMEIGGIQIKKGQNVYKVAFGLNGHNGIDYACPNGTWVRAVHDGELSFYLDAIGYGKNLRLTWEEDGFTWDYVGGHLMGYVGLPRMVKAGEIIAYTNNSGFSSAPHYHEGLRKLKNGQVVDYNNGFLGYIDHSVYFQKESYKVIYKKVGDSTLYFGVGSVLIPFATDYASYLKEFADAVVVELPVSEFIKFKVASELKVKK